MATFISDATLDELRVQTEARMLDAFQTGSSWSSRVATTVPSNGSANVYPLLESIPQIREWLGPAQLQAIKETSYTLRNRRFEAGHEISRDAIADDQIGSLMLAMTGLGRAAAAYPDRAIADIMLNNATCYDGGPFFDPSHPHPSGSGTFSNSGTASVTTDLATTQATIRTTLAAMRSHTGANGDVLDVGTSFVLCVSPTAEYLCRQAVAATVNGGDPNPLAGACEILVVPQLAANSNRSIMLATGGVILPFIRQIRESMRMIVQDTDASPCVAERNSNVYRVTFREAYGVSLPQFAYANDPDGAMT